MQILIATSNPHKAEEIGEILGDAYELLTLKDAGLDGADEPVEDAPDFAGNARIKADYYLRLAAEAGTPMPCLADDSGLCVDALDGAPGVYSARYASEDKIAQRSVGIDPGTDWSDLERPHRDLSNNARLLKALDGVAKDDRSAAFVCSLCLAIPSAAPTLPPAVLDTEGRFPGRIIFPDEADDANQPWLGRGPNGFGYDPLFWVEDDGYQRTSAELAPDEKHALSHRGRAVRQLAGKLRLRLGD